MSAVLTVLFAACTSPARPSSGATPTPTSGGITDLGNGLYQDEFGYQFYLPPSSTRPTDADLAAQAAGTPTCFEASGPFRRLYTKPGTNVNWMSATVSIPALTAAQAGTNATPYIYTGGWSNANKGLDAGFQFFANTSTGGTDWAPFYNMEGGSPAFANPMATDPQGTQKKLHLQGGQDAVLEFYTTDTNLVMKISPKAGATLSWLDYTGGTTSTPAVTDSQPRTFTWAKGSADWSSTGTGQIFKVMTTVAQQPPFTVPSGSTQFTGTKWAGLQYGVRTAAGTLTKNDWTVANLGQCSYPRAGSFPPP